jgi:hypothetical protein
MHHGHAERVDDRELAKATDPRPSARWMRRPRQWARVLGLEREYVRDSYAQLTVRVQYDRSVRAWCVLALAGYLMSGGCVVATTKDDNAPSRWIGELSPRGGLATVDEPATDGPTGKGGTVGFRGDVMYRLAPRFALGLGVDLSMSGHDTAIEKRTASYWWVYLPVLAMRVDLDRFAYSTWLGYYIGSREITEPGCYFGTCTISDQDLQGGGLGIAGFVRLRSEAVSLEIGPYLETHWAYSKEDEFDTADFDEDGMRVRSLAFGLALQVAFGAPDT